MAWFSGSRRVGGAFANMRFCAPPTLVGASLCGHWGRTDRDWQDHQNVFGRFRSFPRHPAARCMDRAERADRQPPGPPARYRREMEGSWSKLSTFDAERVWGKRGHQFVLHHAVQASTHDFVTGMTILTSLAPLTNGAAVAAFPGAPSPLCAVAVLTNYPQTRKSQMTGLAQRIGDRLDKRVRTTPQDVYEAIPRKPEEVVNLKMRYRPTVPS